MEVATGPSSHCTVEHRNGFVLIRASGAFCPALFTRLTDEAVASLRSSGPAGILIDWRDLQGRLDTLDAFTMAEHLAASVSRLRAHVALLVGVAHAREARFIETVCVNRGGLLQSFTDSDAALQWLGEQR